MTMPKPPLWLIETNPTRGFDWFNMHLHSKATRVYEPGRRQPNYANDKTIDGEAYEVNGLQLSAPTIPQPEDTPTQVEVPAPAKPNRTQTE